MSHNTQTVAKIIPITHALSLDSMVRQFYLGEVSHT